MGSTWLAAFSAPAFAQGAQTATKEDQTFVTKAIEGNLAEISMGKLAQEKGQSQDVKNFGAMLVHDHTERPDVGAWIDLLRVENLLRRHVERRT